MKVTKTKLNHFVYQETLRRNNGAKQSTAITTGFLRTFAAQHNPDNARYDQGAVYKIELGTDANNSYLFLFITSQKLMTLWQNLEMLISTWKCMYSGHPLFIPCFTDNGKTWEAGVVLDSDEKTITRQTSGIHQALALNSSCEHKKKALN